MQATTSFKSLSPWRGSRRGGLAVSRNGPAPGVPARALVVPGHTWVAEVAAELRCPRPTRRDRRGGWELCVVTVSTGPVLHTWGSALTHQPHVHMIVPGALGVQGAQLGSALEPRKTHVSLA